MRDEVLFHGTDGDGILGIITSGSILPGNGRIFFSKYRWEEALMHGADTTRQATFVIKVSVSMPDNVASYSTSTPGVRVTSVLETVVPLRAKVLELYVRKPTANGFETSRVVGAQAIQQYLR